MERCAAAKGVHHPCTYLTGALRSTVPLLQAPLDSRQLLLQHAQLLERRPGAVGVGLALPLAVGLLRLRPVLPIWLCLHDGRIRLRCPGNITAKGAGGSWGQTEMRLAYMLCPQHSS